ncbi:GNAT family N-acetyltransferase [Uliginosibacterium sp. H1]|uniref:GNAT family N-acetyltransferase n=1 Tax=Uliginosibacterium sp. H1 TaxID=3114757 RepID=UPI002E17B5B7|nr:GNAT family N-acetyltransferase [Uliginosibacterium sp. H1]
MNRNLHLIALREARPDDATQLAPLLAELGYPQQVEALRRRIAALRAPQDSVWIAESDGCLLGAGSLHLVPMFHASEGLGKVTALVVSAQARGQGIGRALMRALEEHARLHGATRMEVISGNHRPQAHAFYQHLGYAATSQQRFIRPLHVGLPSQAAVPA